MVDFDGLFQGSLFFVSGVVVILAIVGIVYCISYCFDSAGGNELLTPDELEARRLAPILVQQAGLAGLLKHEQTKIIKFHFEVNSFPYVKENNASKARNDESSPKEDKETTTSADEKSEKTVENQEDDVDKETQSVEEGKIEDAASEANDTKDKVDEEVQTPKDEEIENTTDASAEAEQAESPPAESIEKSEDSPEDGSPTPEETTSEMETKEEDGDDKNGSTDEEQKDMESSESKETPTAITEELEEAEEGICSICLGDYEHGEKVIIGTSCGHMFHLSCFMEWVEKKHMDCPICRSDMITPDEFTASAYQVLGDERVDKIRRINEESARRLEEWTLKNQEELQLQLPRSPPLLAAAVDVERGEAVATSSDVSA